MRKPPPKRGPNITRISEVSDPKEVKNGTAHANRSRARRHADRRDRLAARAFGLFMAALVAPDVVKALVALLVKLLNSITTKIP